jgi:hypothetical protein
LAEEECDDISACYKRPTSRNNKDGIYERPVAEGVEDDGESTHNIMELVVNGNRGYERYKKGNCE